MDRKKYILGIDQSTQGTKMLLFDGRGTIVTRIDRPHRQLVNEEGWVSHDMNEIYENIISEVKELVQKLHIRGEEICAVGISNQRETTVAWEEDGMPCCPAIVWQCGRASQIAQRIAKDAAAAGLIQNVTGLPLSPYFPACKMRWLLEHDCRDLNEKKLHLGTVDSYLIYRLTNGEVFATDASNASRTQLMDLENRCWSAQVCEIFKIPLSVLPRILDSNARFGETDFDGVLDRKVPICSVMGDSHSALYGQRCHQAGKMKITYGTGSSIMLNTGSTKAASRHGLATSLAWSIDGKASYVLEGNINYTGAVISWLKNDLGLIASTGEANALCAAANPDDETVIVPAFTGLSAPYWESRVRAGMLGMSRTTKKAEIVKAAVESIAQQITDVFEAMELDFGTSIEEARADGGPTKNTYLMQLQSDLSGACVLASDTEELSAIGTAYLAGITVGLYDKIEVFENLTYRNYQPGMDEEKKQAKRGAWKAAVKSILQYA